jgi:hypothetical protein
VADGALSGGGAGYIAFDPQLMDGADEYSRAKRKARDLLCRILPAAEQDRLQSSGWIEVRGRKQDYQISPYAQTCIVTPKGRLIGHACLQLTLPAPTYDRMLAEYLLIKHDETEYLRQANIFERFASSCCIAAAVLIAFDVALAINLIRAVLTVLIR